MEPKNKKVVVIGGGNGTSALLRGMKNLPLDLAAVVNMSDSGGSTGRIRRELGCLPPGDVRMCLLALADNQELGELFDYRFENGELAGHSFGNLFLSAAEKMYGSFEKAIELAHKTLNASGRVLPVTFDNSHLVLVKERGEVVGQYQIETTNLNPLENKINLRLEPQAGISEPAKEAILAADYIFIGPGNLYASVAPALITDGLADALSESTAKKIYICNLCNSPRHTAGFSVQDYAREVERFTKSGILDYVIYNNTDISGVIRSDEAVVLPEDEQASFQLIGASVVSEDRRPVDPNDAISGGRSILNHDGEAVWNALMGIEEKGTAE